LIKEFVIPTRSFLFAPPETVMEVAARDGAIPYDVPGVELGHYGKECSFDAIMKKYELTNDPALVLLARIVNGADTDNTLWHRPESAGLRAIAEGFRHLGFKDDHEVNAAEWIVYDALYAYCRETAESGRRSAHEIDTVRCDSGDRRRRDGGHRAFHVPRSTPRGSSNSRARRASWTNRKVCSRSRSRDRTCRSPRTASA
jgi:hypothetical protein